MSVYLCMYVQCLRSCVYVSMTVCMYVIYIYYIYDILVLWYIIVYCLCMYTPINMLSNHYFGDLCQTRISLWSFKDLIIYHSYSYVPRLLLSRHTTIIQFRLNHLSFRVYSHAKLFIQFNHCTLTDQQTFIHFNWIFHYSYRPIFTH
jgi:hypothetical protein